MDDKILKNDDRVKLEEIDNSNNQDKKDEATFEAIQMDVDEKDVEIDYRKISISADVKKEFSYILWHADGLMRVKQNLVFTPYSLISSISFKNETGYTIPGLLLSFVFSNTMLSARDIALSPIEPGDGVVNTLPFINVEKSKMEEIVTSESCELTINLIKTSDNSIIFSQKCAFEIIPIPQTPMAIWENKELFAKYVTPLASEVKQITNKAVLKNDGRPIIAYQNNNIQEMLKEMQSIYLALRDQNILYQNPPAGTSITQRIRMQKEVINDKKATCLDSSLLMCACLEEVGYHPLLITIKGHAFVGVYLDEDCTPVGFNGKFSSKSEIAPLCIKGKEKIVFIESTFITNGNTVSFQQAMNEGSDNIATKSDEEFEAIDIVYSHTAGIFAPIPVDNQAFELENYAKQNKVSSTDIARIISDKEYEDMQGTYRLDRFKAWERKLLDLSERNKLIKINFDPKSVCRILGKDLPKSLMENDSLTLYDGVLDAVSDADIIELVELYQSDAVGAYSKRIEAMADDELLGISFPKTLTNLIKNNKSALEETGAGTLHLCMGLVSYPKLSVKGRSKPINSAPFVIIPISIKKEGAKYTMSYDLGDLKINETLFEYYKIMKPDAHYESLYEFEEIGKYYDLVNTFVNMAAKDGLTIRESVFFLANISFAHQVMYLDMKKRQAELSKNVVVDSIVSATNKLQDVLIPEDVKIEDLEKYEDFVAPLYYDSSQLKAILDCGEGKSFILDGPPGTGKSQTIVNMIINAFYHGKRVLFVAEKKAALDVVYDRLSKITYDDAKKRNLGDFCLELHSNKATKADFFKKIGSSIELGPIGKPKDYKEKCEKLTTLKNELRKRINKMHDTNDYFMSLYDCIIISKKLEYMKDSRIEFSEKFLKNYDRNKNARIESLISAYNSTAESEVKNFDFNPLKRMGIQNIDFMTDRTLMPKELTSCISIVGKFASATKTLLAGLPFKVEESIDSYETIYKIYDAIYNKDIYGNALLEVVQNRKKLLDSIENAKAFKELKNEITNDVDIDALLEEVDIKAQKQALQEAGGFFKKRFIERKVIKELEPYFEVELDATNVGIYILKVLEYIEKKNSLDLSNELLCNIISSKISENLDSLNEIENKINNTIELVDNIKTISGDNLISGLTYFSTCIASNNALSKLAFEQSFALFKEYKDCDNLLSTKYLINKKSLQKGDYFKDLEKLLKYAANEENFEQVQSIAVLNKLNNGFIDEGVEDLVQKVIEERVRYYEMQDLLRYSLAIGYLELYFKIDNINSFAPTQINDKIAEYKKYIDLYNDLSVKSVAAKISENFPRAGISYSASSDKTILKKLADNNGRGISIRKTLSAHSEVILQFFPCFLMSPLSAAQYLSVDTKMGKAFPKFDIVIFDEASQIPTHEAIGPIARGKSLIIAGDPKQMPPSPYFSAGLQLFEDDDEDSDSYMYSDSSSLLDECISFGMPRHNLQYHYRSKHESLIQFSNHYFYDDNLYTFPSSSTATSNIEFKQVKTAEPKKDSKISKEEIKAITEAYKKIYKDEATKNKSVGIITFNIGQADVIMKAITELTAKDKGLAERVAKAEEKTKEPLFVKSIENVQGDERDIIILSIGFALTKQGYPKLGGPLIAGDNNGNRRLNVAASRSKEKMIVISTITSSQFQDDSMIKNPGAKSLKRFIKYAEESALVSSNSHEVNDDNILWYIRRDLENEGLNVDLNVGCGEYRVDIAIKTDDKKSYILGVIVDNRAISEKITCRDKYYVQSSVLKAMKWHVLTIYALEYFKTPKQTIEKILDKIKEIKEYNEPDAIEKNDFEIESIDYEIEDVPPAYKTKQIGEVELPEIKYTDEYGFDSKIDGYIDKIIKEYAPVTHNFIAQQIAASLGIQKLTQVQNRRLQDVLKKGFYKEREFDQTQYVYWADSKREVDYFKTGITQNIYDIAKEEISNCMYQIIEEQGQMKQDDLYKTVLALFSCKPSGLTADNRERLNVAYEYAKEKGMI